jgi:predicted ATP-grasp superfamily ATP-dependent carboligase
MQANPELKVLVTDGNNRAALAITRSLGSAGYTVFVAGEGKSTLAGASRYCKQRFDYSDPGRQPDRFREDILRIVCLNRIDILIPAAEVTTCECMKVKEALEDQCVVPFQSHRSVRRAASKYEVLKLAQDLSIPIPATCYLHRPDDIEKAVHFGDRNDYPVVIKPSRSRVEIDGMAIQGSAQYANNGSDLKHVVQEFHPAQYPLLIQERIQGAGVGIFACFNRGEAVAYFSHRRIREKPPSGGVSVLRESFPVDAALKLYSARLLQALQWHGVAMVEFKMDERRGGYKLMEVNGRFWGSLQLAIDAGVDFPLLLARIAEGRDVKPVESYRLDVRTRWLWGDIDSLLARLFKAEDRLHLPDHFPDRKQYLKAFFRPCRKDLNFEVLKWHDPMPWLFETMHWLRLLKNTVAV